jgi:hypothetical protein
LAVVLLRFAKKTYQLYINGLFALCFFGAGIPATVLGGLWGFALAAVAANAVRFFATLLLGWYWVCKSRKNAAKVQ